jgi:hypothetical protein
MENRMNKDPNYNRHAGIVTLDSPLYPNQRRPFRVDEDGIEIYADDELRRVSQLGKDRPIHVAESPNPSWSGYGVLRAQGERDGQRLRAALAGLGGLASEPSDNQAPLIPLEHPSIPMMTTATNDALRTVWAGNGEPGYSSGLNTEFARMEHLPDFSKGKWKKVSSIHSSEAYEHALPGSSGMAVKVYLRDRSHNGLNTVTITTPTESTDHYGAVPAYLMGLPVNSRNAAMYLADQRERRKAKQ